MNFSRTEKKEVEIERKEIKKEGKNVICLHFKERYFNSGEFTIEQNIINHN